MSPAGQLRHRCTIERDVSAEAATDAHRQRPPRWETHAEGVPCRLVARAQRVPDGVLAESAVVTTYTLLLSPRQNLPGGQARIVDVVAHDGAPIEPGPFRVDGTLRRTGAMARSHISLALTLLGGRHAR